MAQKSVFQMSPVEQLIGEYDAARNDALSQVKSVEMPTPRLPALPSQGDGGGRQPSARGGVPTALVPFFENAAAQYNVPINVVMALAEQESSYNPRALGVPTKWGRAKGIMQYLDSTASGMGINPYDPEQAIGAAARQIRERLDKGYSMEDAVKEHFAGPNRAQWGPKTRVYGQEVLSRAARLGGEIGDRYANVTPQPQPVNDNAPIAAPQEPPPEQGALDSAGEVAGDLGAQFVGGAYKGTGSLLQGLGAIPQLLGDYTTTPLVNAIFGTEYRTGNLMDKPAEVVSDYGKSIQAGVSEATQEAIKASTPDGDVFDPSTWTLGEQPSVRGYAALGADVLGGMLPLIAQMFATKGMGAGTQTAASATTGGLQGGGAGIEQARETIDKMATTKASDAPDAPSVLEQESTYYRALVAQGKTPEQALQLTKDAAEKYAFILTTPISALGGVATSRIINPAEKILSGSNIAGRVVGRAALGAGEEGSQEVAESIATKTGVNEGAGTNVDVTEGTFGDLVLGALAGGTMGAGAGSLSRRESTGPAAGLAMPEAPADAAAQPQAAEAPPQMEAPTPTITEGSSANGVMSVEIAHETPAAPAGPMARSLAKLIPDAAPADAPQQRVVVTTEGMDPLQGVSLGETEAGVWVRGDDGNEVLIPAEQVQSGEVQITPVGEAVADVAPAPMVEAAITPEPIADAAPAPMAEPIADAAPAPMAEPIADAAPAPMAEPIADAAPAPMAEPTLVAEPVAQTEAAPVVEAAPPIAEQAPQAAPAAPETPRANDYSAMDEPELRERLKYLAGQAKTNGGWDKRLMTERKKVEAAIDAAATREAVPATDASVEQDAPAQDVPAQEVAAEPVKWFGSQEKADAFIARKNLADTHQVVPAGRSRFEIQPKAASPVQEAAAEAATSPTNALPEPTEAQREAGNFKKGHVRINGLDISIEHPAGVPRKPGQSPIAHPYGYVRETVGRDKDHVDVFLGPKSEDPTNPVYVIDQVDQDGNFDEHKVMLGFSSATAAREGYLASYPSGWTGLGAVRKMESEVFKQWVKDPVRTSRPVSTKVPDNRAPVTAGRVTVTPPPAAHVDAARRADQERTTAPATDTPSDRRKAEEFVSAPDGSPNFGEITQELADAIHRQAAPIRLRQGNDAWGLEHIRARHETQIKALGFDSVEAFVGRVAGGFTAIYKRDGRSLDVVLDAGERGKLIVQLEPSAEGDFYDVKTATPIRSDQYRNKTPLWVRAGPSAPPAEAGLLDPRSQSGEPNIDTDVAQGKTAPAAVSPRTPLNDDFGNYGLPTGTRLVSTTGRALAPSPKFDAETPRKRTMSIDRQRAWLVDEAVKEAEARRDGFMGGMLKRLDPKNFSRSDFDTVNDYLFDDADGPTAASLMPAPAAREAKAGASANTIFTDDAAEKARALLRRKLNQLNSGIDPEIMQAGITLAGYHIEKGARSFAAYAQAMLIDLGDSVRPYLKSWYMGVKYDPRAAQFEGMSKASEVEDANIDAIASEGKESVGEPTELDQPGEGALAGAPAAPVRAAESEEQAGGRAARSSGADAPGNERAGRAGDVDPGSVGGDAGAVPVPAGRAGDGRRAASDGSPVQRSDADNPAGRGRSSVTPSGGVVAEQRAGNFTITEADDIGSGGAKTKYKNNVAAIRILKTLDAEGRAATRDEQAALAKYVGWGGLPQAFERSDKSAGKGWEREVAELRSLLTDAEYTAAASSTKNAHYTSPEIVNAMWDAVRHMGFARGRVLEPSVGVGNFFGLMPRELRNASALHGVELDRITSGIASHLYPEAKIARMGFQDFTIPDGYFDIAIGNPPFGREQLYDGKRKDLSGFSIHNYFFARSIDALRPGGVLAMVVTNRFMDVPSDKARAYISERADLLGAIRLPNNAFLANAGTEVTTDIIILRKRADGEKASGASWGKVVDYTNGEGAVLPLNEYFAANPDQMLGEFGPHGSMYRADEPALISRPGQDTAALLAAAVARLPANVMAAATPAVKTETSQTIQADHVRVGSMFVDGDRVMMRTEDTLGENQAEVVTFPSDKARDRVVGMLSVRDMLSDLRKLQLDPRADSTRVEAARKRLNAAYDKFTKANGPINADANKRLMRDDPSWPQLAALEDSFDKGVSAAVAAKTGEVARKPSATKAAIFTKRTQSPYQPPSSAKTAKDALVSSLSETGRVDMELMSRLYGKSEAAIVRELGDLVFQDPQKGLVTSDEYLSGNVKAKLAQARAAGPEFEANVKALEAVQPADIEAVDINVKPGASWIPAQHMKAFAELISEGTGIKAVYNPVNARWSFMDVRASAAAAQRFATGRVTVKDVLEATANQKTMTVYDTHADGSRSMNETETQLANDKVNAVKSEFSQWIWQDDARRAELHRLYNDVFNTDVRRQFDGSHLTLPGKVGDDIVKLRPHQLNAVWRALQSGTTLYDHVVGAGKTFTVVAAAMEMRRMGLAKKPMVAVPNHLVGQWAADFVKLYPNANILAATKRDFEKGNRKRLFARIATGDWDAVIVAHSSFGKVEVDPKVQAEFIEEQIMDLDASIELMAQTDGKGSRNVKDTTKRRDMLREKLERLFDAENKDDSLYWNELGVDALFLDEAHEFKNLAFSTGMTRVAGLGNQTGSQKAADMLLKVRQVLKATGGRNVVFATGTPISNTMAEMYTMQRYLDHETLKVQGMAHFDAWARNFGEVVTDWELSPSGKYKMNSRFAKFVNMPELMQRYTSFADVINRDDINRMLASQGKKLPVPKMKGGKPQNVVVERSRDQAAYIGLPVLDADGNETDAYTAGSLVHRSENLPKKAEKGGDNMLKIMSDARKAALDMRLIDPSYPDSPTSKVNNAANRIKAIYDQWTADRGAQLVFIDLSTPKNAKAAETARIRDIAQRADEGDESAIAELDKLSPDELAALDSDFSVYDDLKMKLIGKGIPPAEIAYIHDAKTELQKDELFGKVRSGRIRVLLGSTAKMGAGMNVQNRLVALHHLDAPWRPSDLEQREGRIIRQGNELYERNPDGFEVEVLRYATKQTLDSRMWQTIEGKANFIEQVRKGDSTVREVEDVAGEAANAAEMKAASSGNPMILEEMSLRQDIRRLENERSGHDREQFRLRDSVREKERTIGYADRSLKQLRADAKLPLPKEFQVTIEGTVYDKRKDAGEAILAKMADMRDSNGQETADIGTYGGFQVSLEHVHTDSYQLTLRGDGEYATTAKIGADPLGLVVRMTNLVSDLAADIEATEAARAKAEADIPKLKAQVAEWSKSAELDTARSRHSDVIDELKPKKKAPAEKPAEAAAAKKSESATPADGFADAPALAAHLQAGEFGSLVTSLTDSGRVVFHTDETTLPAGAARHSARGGIQGMTTPDGVVHLVASNVTPKTAVPVLLHEMFHAGASPLLGGRRWTNLMDRVRSIYDAAVARQIGEQVDNSRSAQFWDAALARVDDAQTPAEYRVEEIAAYAIENHESAPAGLRTIVDSLLGEVKSWLLRRFGVQVGAVTPAQLRSLAVAAMRSTASSPRGTPGPGRGRYSISPTPAPTQSQETRFLRGRLSDTMNKAMGPLLMTVPMRPLLTELAKDLPAAQDYLALKQKMDTKRSDWHGMSDKVSQRWLKYRVKNRAENERLMNLMHETTLAQADPSKPFEPMMTKMDRQTLDTLKPGTDAYDAALAKQVRDRQRQRDHAALVPRYNALSAEAKAIYNEVRDTYAKLSDEFERVLIANMEKSLDIQGQKAERAHRKAMQEIKDEGLTGKERDAAVAAADKALKSAKTKSAWNKGARMARMRAQFETQTLAGPYFPLARFGKYFVTVRDSKSGEVVSFSRFESPTKQRQFIAEMRQDPEHDVQFGVLDTANEARKQVDPRFVADIESILEDAAAGDAVKDQVWQRYLDTMPDMSVRKNRIHRKGREGYTGDALRAFGSHMFHGAHQAARLEYAMDLGESVDRAREQAAFADDPNRANMVVTEMAERHAYVMNPKGKWWSQAVTSAAFIYYLSMSPASALVNLSQTVIMGVPIMAAFHGDAVKGSAVAQVELMKAMKDFTVGMGKIENAKLAADEKAAIESAYEMGLIDKSQAHDLAGVGESGVEYSAVRTKVMGIISWQFHQTERLNREVTFMAAYRIARDRHGLVGDSAVDAAADLTWKIHFDYQNTSRPRMMHGDWAKALLVFRNFNVNMLYRLFRDTHQAINGESKAERKEALTQLGGITAMMALNAGVRGTWLFGIAMTLASMFGVGGDDPEEELKKGVVSLLGPNVGGMVLNGIPGHALGIDITGRVGMPDLWFRSPDRQLEGQDEFNYWQTQLLGAAPGIAQNVFRGVRMIQEDNTYRGVETMMPKWGKDLMRSYRFATEGATTLKGDPLLEDMSTRQVITQALGFTPAALAERYQTNNAMKNREMRITGERSRILNDYAKADRDDDLEAIRAVEERIEAFNLSNPDYEVNNRAIRTSLKSRQRSRDRMENGVSINPKLNDRIREEAAPNIYD